MWLECCGDCCHCRYANMCVMCEEEVWTLSKEELLYWACVLVIAVLAFLGGALTVLAGILIIFGGI